MKTLYKILSAIFLIIVVILLTKFDRKAFHFKDFYYNALVKLHLIKPCYNPNDDFKEIFAQEGFNYDEMNKKITQASLAKLADKNVKLSENSKIPSITHHIYFTPKDSSKKLIDFYAEKMKANYNKLNDLDVEWKHYIWTNNPKIFPEEIKQIKGVEIKSVAELDGHQLYGALVEAISNGEKLKAHFAESADILRIIVVQKFGGIYNDMDYEIYNAKALYDLMRKFDFIGGRELTKIESYYGNSFIAAKANHPILNDVVTRIYSNISNLNGCDYLKHPCNLYDKIYFNGIPVLTFAYFSKNNQEENNDVILPPWMIFNVEFARFKNKTCVYEDIEREDFNKNNQNLDQLIIEFNKQIKDSNTSNDNIYYNLKDRSQFEMIGADMFCGGWSNTKVPKIYYWRF